MLEVQAIQKTFKARGREVRALQGVSFVVRPGEIVALLGENGAGKTTTMRVICGLIRPDAGQVSLEGHHPASSDYATRLGALLDTARSSYARLSVLENLIYTASIRGLPPGVARQRALELTEQFGLVHKRDAPAQTLSKGMASKLALAHALVHQPRVLLLDEPTLGLDVEASDALEARVRALAAAGVAVLLTTHQMEIADRLAHRVVILADGRVLLDADKDKLVSHFGAQTYRLVFAAPFDLGLEYPHQWHGNQLTITLPQAADFYVLVEALRPRAILKIERLEADLNAVFRRVLATVKT